MKAAYIEQVGPPEIIRYGELPIPNLGTGQILVKVAAVCVDPIDVYIRSGRFSVPLPFPFVIGRDMVGRVERLGNGVTGFSCGETVWCNNQGYDGRQGTFSEYVVVDESLLYRLPPGCDEKQAVSFVHAGLTACIGLQRAQPKPGETLFVNGGSGSVGSAIVQLATARGLRVVATAGTDEGQNWCASIGAESVFNYRSDDLRSNLAKLVPGGVDIFWDTSGRPDFDFAVESLAPRGRLILMSGLGARPPFPVGPFYVKCCSMHGFAITHATPTELRRSADEINGWFASGKLRVRVGSILPLSEAAKAHEIVEEKPPMTGKVVLIP